jgi:hypothetical protein
MPTTTDADPAAAPVPLPAPDSKWWAQSMTIWGAIITAAATVAPVLGPRLGIDISPELVQQFGEQVLSTAQAGGGLLGTILTIYGRVRATTPLARRQITMRV